MFMERAARRRKPSTINRYFRMDEVIGFDYRSQTPWQAKKEFLAFFTEQRGRCEHLTLVANSIGAFFALSSLDETLVDRAYFISPIVDMENLICNMMQWSNVTKQELAEKREIATNFGETLSWEYLCYVRKHPIIWNVPTCILYGEHDNLTSIETVSAFAKLHHADLTVIPGGEHWFHTDEQMQFLDQMDQRAQLERCLRLMILNGVNNETRIKVSGRQREWSFRNCTHTYVGRRSPRLWADRQNY